MRIIYTPAFPDQETLTDHYYRALWALRAFLNEGAEIIMPTNVPGARPGTRPAYFDSGLDKLSKRFSSSFSYKANPHSKPGDKDIVLAWNATDLPKGKNVYCVDELGFHPAAERYLRPLKALAGISDDAQRFKKWLSDHQTDNAWVIGTGPKVDQLTFSRCEDDLVIICNSMVRNYELLDTLKPSVITFSDPVFHSGPSRIAARFRSDLLRAARTYGCLLLTQTQDAILLRSHFPKDVHAQIIGLPTTRAEPVLPNFMNDASAHETRNILTLLMFPLAASTAKHIHIAGFDGKNLKRPEEKGYFWKHSAKNQYQSDMISAELAHPAFFQVDFDAYYTDHIDLVETQCLVAEKRGIEISNHTPSFIPAFSKRRPSGLSLNVNDETIRMNASARFIDVYSKGLTRIGQNYRRYFTAYILLCGFTLLCISLLEDFKMNPVFFTGMILVITFGLLLTLAYVQFTARRLETRLRRDLTDQSFRVSQRLFERLERLEKESADK